MSQNKKPLIYIIAGEESGDILGKSLMVELKKTLGSEVEFAGIGGAAMQKEGMKSLFPMEDLSLFGVAEVLPKIPLIIKRINQAVSDICSLQPDIVLTIDAPDFNFRVAKKLRKKIDNGELSTKLVHYVAPSVWIWRKGRAKKIAKFLDHLLTLLPFEPKYFEKEGLDSTFVGHSMVESKLTSGNAASFRKSNNIVEDKKILLLLPGSRRGEISKLLPIFASTIKSSSEILKNWLIIIPAMPKFRKEIEQTIEDWEIETLVINGQDAEKFDAFAAAKIAIAASGTAGLELGIAGVPTIIAYKINHLSAIIFGLFIKAKWVNLINIILEKDIVPEYLQYNCTPDKLSGALKELIENKKAQEKQIKAGKKVAEILGFKGNSPSQKAANALIKLLPNEKNI